MNKTQRDNFFETIVFKNANRKINFLLTQRLLPALLLSCALLFISLFSLLFSSEVKAEIHWLQPPVVKSSALNNQQDKNKSKESAYKKLSAKEQISPKQLLTRPEIAQYAQGFIDQLFWAKSQQSLQDQHILFQRKINGVPVFGQQLTISYQKDNQQLVKVFENLQNQPEDNSIVAKITAEQALQLAWQRRKVTGDLYGKPQQTLVWLSRAKKLKLAWLVQLDVYQPFGHWSWFIDANNGQTLKVMRREISHIGLAKSDRNKPQVSLSNALEKFSKKQKIEQVKHSQNVALSVDQVQVAGSAQVFDPDPRTTLNSNALTDTSSAGAFTGAYQNVSLPDVSYSGSVYHLSGPWVNVTDFDPPHTTPTTSNSGSWNFQRGQLGFNDAMTYFHLDKNQRYIQSLGFSGSNGIQQGAIAADSNGADGADNSYFSGSYNRLSFGHGCVDDNEDADVILHEYGHAINHNINSQWQGGDTGAMGEGFGDYWAASYSYSTPNGASYQPFKVFTWDAADGCWAGRRLDKTSARYNPAVSYTAHSRQNGFVSDELWSTPLFQALVELIDQGQTRQEVDKIILEAQFGLGANLTMRQMAESIVLTARRLYPAGPHAAVFQQQFIHHEILSDEQGLALELLATRDSGNDGYADPGDLLTMTVRLRNQYLDSLPASSLAVSASVLQVQNQLQIPELASYTSADMELQVQVSETMACGMQDQIRLQGNYQIGGENLPVDLIIPILLGEPAYETTSRSLNFTIPDNRSQVEALTINIAADAASVVDEYFQLAVNIRHSYIGDIQMELVSPAGTRVRLKNRSADNQDDLRGSYPADFTPVDSFSAFYGEPMNGTWTLEIADRAAADKGVLENFSLRWSEGYICGEHTPLVVPGKVTTGGGSLHWGWLALLGAVFIRRLLPA
ncbi:proprotein convertase P-domain-containing protein [Pelagibaculum spongiae]|uniref:P/Homo B domain-containing protein n=1 Tax=Pelagibaculum spongiae TaxID=2080658 RepID=A0A2V1H192_9GAMM|nr:proprotein convertase P-domain-containing protein [Pelagibaculum spongiae]PVZ72449.1 hypothetical protein DC094_05440 [Pelagibaculum spongiae]